MASGTIKSVVPRSDIVNNLTTNDSTKVLSAAQGKTLKDNFGNIYNEIFYMANNNTITITRTTQHQIYEISASSYSGYPLFIVASNSGIANLGGYGAAKWNDDNTVLTVVCATYREVMVKSNFPINYTLSTTSGTFSDASNWNPKSSIDALNSKITNALHVYYAPSTGVTADTAIDITSEVNLPSGATVRGIAVQCVYGGSSVDYKAAVVFNPTTSKFMLYTTITQTPIRAYFTVFYT